MRGSKQSRGVNQKEHNPHPHQKCFVFFQPIPPNLMVSSWVHPPLPSTKTGGPQCQCPQSLRPIRHAGYTHGADRKRGAGCLGAEWDQRAPCFVQFLHLEEEESPVDRWSTSPDLSVFIRIFLVFGFRQQPSTVSVEFLVGLSWTMEQYGYHLEYLVESVAIPWYCYRRAHVQAKDSRSIQDTLAAQMQSLPGGSRDRGWDSPPPKKKGDYPRRRWFRWLMFNSLFFPNLGAFALGVGVSFPIYE